jgi:predicted DNA-binding transcriptional regulator
MKTLKDWQEKLMEGLESLEKQEIGIDQANAETRRIREINRVLALRYKMARDQIEKLDNPEIG